MRISTLCQLLVLGNGGIAAASESVVEALLPPGGPKDDCKCLPSDKCWPSDKEWEKLDKKVGGRLQATVPLGQPCHGDAYDEAKCQELKDEWLFSSIQ